MSANMIEEGIEKLIIIPIIIVLSIIIILKGEILSNFLIEILKISGASKFVICCLAGLLGLGSLFAIGFFLYDSLSNEL